MSERERVKESEKKGRREKEKNPICQSLDSVISNSCVMPPRRRRVVDNAIYALTLVVSIAQFVVIR